MIRVKQQLSLDFADLRYVEITCPTCAAKMTLDLRNRKSRAPDSCCGCGLEFDATSVQSPLAEFINVYRALTHKELKVRFGVLVDAPGPAPLN